MSDAFFRTQPLGLDGISGLTLASGVTQSADYAPFYSGSATSVQKALITNLFGGFTAAAGGTTGYLNLPGGFIAQWTTQGSSSTPMFATWPIAFQTACYAWVAQPTNQVTGVLANAGTAGVTHNVSAGSPTIRFFGIGK